MGILKKRLGMPWVSACVAASLFTVMAGSNAQDTMKSEKTERAERHERAGMAESSRNSEKAEKAEKGEKDTVTAHLSGDKEVPPVQTNASGQSTIKVDEKGVLSGKVTVENMTPTGAHIHQGPADKVGPVIIPLKKTAKNTYSVPAGKKLTDDQFSAFKEGNLYINVHSKKYPGGEIRAQMKP